jgi:hypothetical protein
MTMNAGQKHKDKETQVPRGFIIEKFENKYKVGTTQPLEDAHLNAA